MTPATWLRAFEDGGRVTVLHGPDGMAFRIRAQRSVVGMIFLPVWLLGWSRAGLPALRYELALPSVFMTVWLLGWVFGMVTAPVALAWVSWGSETLSVANGDLVVHLRIFDPAPIFMSYEQRVRRGPTDRW